MVSLIGVITVGNPVAVVLEYCELGSLLSFLQKEKVSEHLRNVLAGDTAEGLLYLSSRVCHVLVLEPLPFKREREKMKR